MKSRIICSKIRSRISFFPTPENPAFPTDPVFVESREVRDLKEIPETAKYIYFDDVVETQVFFTDGERILLSPSFNKKTYAVTRSRNEAATLTTNNWMSVEVHPLLADQVWVFETFYQRRDRAA